MGIRDRFRRISNESDAIARDIAQSAEDLPPGAGEQRVWEKVNDIYRDGLAEKQSRVYHTMVANVRSQQSLRSGGDSLPADIGEALADFSRIAKPADMDAPPLPPEAPNARLSEKAEAFELPPLPTRR